jgi:hypothetical protein
VTYFEFFFKKKSYFPYLISEGTTERHKRVVYGDKNIFFISDQSYLEECGLHMQQQ